MKNEITELAARLKNINLLPDRDTEKEKEGERGRVCVCEREMMVKGRKKQL